MTAFLEWVPRDREPRFDSAGGFVMADVAIEVSEGAGIQRSAGAATTGEPAGATVIGEMLSDASLGARRLEVAAGTAFYEADVPARTLFFIHEGQVRIFQVGQVGPKPSTQLVEILGPGDWFGIPALTSGEGSRYGMRAVAVTAATVSEVPAERLLAALPNQPAVARELISQLASKLQAAYGHSANLVFDDTEKRLIKALLQFSRTSAAAPIEGEGGEGSVVLRITHQQLAQAVGAARETVSLTLTQLRQQNLLRTGRNRLLFNPQVLENFSRRNETPASDAPAGPLRADASEAE
jgi:CRP/FNR family cyclic AMP-dependent transcriptional regulator